MVSGDDDVIRERPQRPLPEPEGQVEEDGRQQQKHGQHRIADRRQKIGAQLALDNR
jgi:hypothetical protein